MRLIIQCPLFLLGVLPYAVAGQRLPSAPLASVDTSAFRVNERGRSQEHPEIKSKAAAVWMSVSATLLPGAAGLALLGGQPDDDLLAAALIGSSIVIGPSAGHFYIGRPGGVLLRLGVAAATTSVAFTAASDEGGYGGLGVFVGVMAAGTAIILIDGIYDIARVGGAVRRHNASQASRGLTAGPIVEPASGRLGLGMRLEFSRGR